MGKLHGHAQTHTHTHYLIKNLIPMGKLHHTLFNKELYPHGDIAWAHRQTQTETLTYLLTHSLLKVVHRA